MNKSITFIIGSMINGGAERVISVISDKYAENNYDVHLIIFRKNSIKTNYNINSKIKCHYLTNSNNRFIRNIIIPFKLLKTMKEIDSDIYISFCILENSISALVNIFASKILIISERNAPKDEKLSAHLKLLRKVSYRFCNGIIFQTIDAMKCYPKRLQAKGVVIPNPIKENLPIKNNYNDTYKFVAVGRLAQQKNYILLLRAFKKFSEVYDSYNLYIYGQGPKKDELIDYVIKNNIDKKVYFEGFKHDVHYEILNADAFIMTSDYEGMPNALMEAMAMGMPCISTDCPSGGPKELINNNENGVLIEVNNVHMLTDAMKKIKYDRNFRESIGNEAKKVYKKYNLDYIFSLWEKYTNGFINKNCENI